MGARGPVVPGARTSASWRKAHQFGVPRFCPVGTKVELIYHLSRRPHGRPGRSSADPRRRERPCLTTTSRRTPLRGLAPRIGVVRRARTATPLPGDPVLRSTAAIRTGTAIRTGAPRDRAVDSPLPVDTETRSRPRIPPDRRRRPTAAIRPVPEGRADHPSREGRGMRRSTPRSPGNRSSPHGSSRCSWETSVSTGSTWARWDWVCSSW